MSSILKYQIASIIFSIIVGSILHFTYELSGNNAIVASFSAVNESVWEHLKLVFFPMLITTIIGYFAFRDIVPNFICAKTIGIIFSVVFIPVFFYTYTGIIGTHNLFMDILSFFIAIIIGEYIAYVYMLNGWECNKTVSVIVLIILSLIFIIFTFNPPKLKLFQEQSTGIYGIGKIDKL